jgi:hypothetical protein
LINTYNQETKVGGRAAKKEAPAQKTPSKPALPKIAQKSRLGV